MGMNTALHTWFAQTPEHTLALPQVDPHVDVELRFVSQPSFGPPQSA